MSLKRHPLFNSRLLSTTSKLTLVRALVEPIARWGLPVWGVNAATLASLQATLNKAYKGVLNIPGNATCKLAL